MTIKWKLPILLTLIFGYLQYSLWLGKNNFFDLKKHQAQIYQMQIENAALKQRNEQMFAELSNLYNGKDAIEERARSQLGMIKSGEHFFRIIDDNEQQKDN